MARTAQACTVIGMEQDHRRAARAGRACWVGAAVLALAGAAPAQPLLVKIGHAAPTRGWLARVGIENESAARLAVETLNARGVRIGGQAATFELVRTDDSGDADQARAAARSLVDAGVVAVVGHMTSGAAIAAAPVYAEAGLPQVTPSATAPGYTRMGLKTTFRVVADDTQVAQALARHTVDALKLRRALTIDDGSAYGRGVTEAYAAALRTLGGTVLDRQHLDDGEAVDAARVAGWKALAPEAVFYGGFDREAGTALRQMRAAGLDAALLGGDGICTPDLVSYWAAGAARDGQVVCALPRAMPGSGEGRIDEFVAAYQKRYGRDPEFYGAHAYDAVMLLADAMVRAGSALPQRVVPALAATAGYEGTTGVLAFDERGDLRRPALTLYRYVGEQRRPLRTVQAAD